MKKKLGTTIIFIIMLVSPLSAADAPYTLEDRDRLINVDATLRELRISLDKQFNGIDNRFEQIDKRFEQVDKSFEQVDKRFEQIDKRFEQIDRRMEKFDSRFNEILSFIMWGFGVVFTGIFALIGFILWDRRSALAPAIRKNKDLEDKEEKIEKVLKELATMDTRIADAMKHAGLL